MTAEKVSPENERDALESCRSGDTEGLRILYEQYGEKVFRTCLRILGDRESAEDATHEIFIKLFHKSGRFSGRSSFSTWLYRLAVNHLLNVVKRKRRRAMGRSDSPVDSIEDGIHRSVRIETRISLASLLASLKPEHRTILVLREVEDLDYMEISEILGIPRGTVMSRLSRAREALRNAWKKEEVAP